MVMHMSSRTVCSAFFESFELVKLTQLIVSQVIIPVSIYQGKGGEDPTGNFWVIDQLHNLSIEIIVSLLNVL